MSEQTSNSILPATQNGELSIFDNINKRSLDDTSPTNMGAKRLKEEDVSLQLMCIPDTVMTLFGSEILPHVSTPEDKRNCMLVCKAWKNHVFTKAAWKNVHTLNISDCADPNNEPNEFTVHVMEENEQWTLAADEHLMLLLQLCTNVTTINIRLGWAEFRTAQFDPLASAGAKTLFEWMNNGLVRFPKLSFVNCETGAHNTFEGALRLLKRFDERLSATFSSVPCGLDQHIHDFVEHYSSNNNRNKMLKALGRLLSHHGQRLECFDLIYEDPIAPIMKQLVKHKVRSLRRIKCITPYDDDVLIDVINKQTRGSLKSLVLNVEYIGCFLERIRPRVQRTIQHLKFFNEPATTTSSIVTRDVCHRIAKKYPALVKLSLPSNQMASSWHKIAGVLDRFARSRSKFKLYVGYLALKSGGGRKEFLEMSADELDQLLRDEFEFEYRSEHKLVERIESTRTPRKIKFKLRLYDCEFILKIL